MPVNQNRLTHERVLLKSTHTLVLSESQRIVILNRKHGSVAVPIAPSHHAFSRITLRFLRKIIKLRDNMNFSKNLIT